MEKINGAGDIEIKQIDLVGKYSTTSLVGLYTEVQIFEDIF